MSQDTSTAVAIPGVGHVPTDEEIENIRKAGKQVAAHKKEVRDLYRVIEGLEWGSGKNAVKGSSLSKATRYAFAEFCRITRANPMHHVDILGGGFYLNAEYWSDLINSDPYFVRYEQRDLSPSVENALRERAEAHRELAAKLEGEEEAQRLAKALELEEEADDVALARAQWSPRETATCVIETTIWRFMNAAPIDAIKSGEVTDFERYIITVSECNWAGGMGSTMADAKKWDPIGDANPATTARTRSLRRCAVRAFSAWMQRYEEQIKKAEEIVEAEFTIIREDNAAARAALPAEGEPQAARTGSGEPGAANENGAQPLPEDGEEPEARPEPETADGDDFDVDDARGRYFATLRDAGIEDRKAWQVENGLPESTKVWTREQWERAIELLMAPTREKFRIGCRMAGVEEDAVAQEVLEREPDTLKDYQQLLRHVNRLVDQQDHDEQTEAVL